MHTVHMKSASDQTGTADIQYDVHVCIHYYYEYTTFPKEHDF